MATNGSPARASLLFLELNEADRHFLDRFCGEEKLPAFQRMRAEGLLLNTRVPGWNARARKAWRDISPWIIWPSVYTGLAPEEHRIVGFGQDTSHLRGKFVWDVLDAHGVSTGVFGSLMSYPPRTQGAARYYVPESLADEASCFPESVRPVQEFNVLASRNYSEGFGRNGIKALGFLLKSTRAGVRIGTVARTVAQIPAEKLFGARREPERAMLASTIGYEAFKELYVRHRPAYASVHMNHVAYMQHRYWRAAEPDRFADELSETDRRFFRTVAERRAYERGFAHWIERSFRYSDRVLADLMELALPGTVILVGTALGQRPLDPCGEIHNPVVRLVRERELFDAIGLRDYTVLHQMNPDVTIHLADEGAAQQAGELAAGLYVMPGEPLFAVQRRGRQLFLELEMPQKSLLDGEVLIRHSGLPHWSAPFARYVEEHGNNDQSTAHHKDVGILMAWCKGGRVESVHSSIAVTDIAPAILRVFDLPAQAWHRPQSAPAFELAA